jgi:hypothetical protein
MLPIRAQVGRDHSAVGQFARAVHSFQDDRARTVAKQDAGGPIRPVQNPGKDSAPITSARRPGLPARNIASAVESANTKPVQTA